MREKKKSPLYWSYGLINLWLGILRFSSCAVYNSGIAYAVQLSRRSFFPSKRAVIYHSMTQHVFSLLIEAYNRVWLWDTNSLFCTLFDMLSVPQCLSNTFHCFCHNLTRTWFLIALIFQKTWRKLQDWPQRSWSPSSASPRRSDPKSTARPRTWYDNIRCCFD